MDYETLSSELVRALRGRRSQTAFSRRLGYSANVLYTWEKGRRFPTTGVFFSAAARVRADVKPKLEAFLGVKLSSLPIVDEAVAELLAHLRANLKSSELGRALGVNRTTIARWLNAKTQPRLPELLRWVAATTQRLLEFVSIFVDPSQLSSTREAYRAFAAQRTLAYDVPWSHAILRAIETNAYQRLKKPAPGTLALMVGLSPDEEPALLEQLALAGQIERRRGRWVVKEVLTVDTRAEPEKNWLLKRHWATIGLERILLGPHGEGVFSYNLFAISNADLASIRELHVEYFERVRAIISACKNSERVVLINQQLIPLGAVAPE